MSTPVPAAPAATAAPVTPPAPATPPVTPTVTPPATTTPTPAAITGKFFETFRGKMKPKIVADPPKPAAAAPATPAPAAPVTPPAKPGFDPNLPTPPRRQPQPDVSSIVKAAVAGAMEASRPAAAVPAKPVEPDLPKPIARKLEKLDLLEGSEFKTIRREAEDFYKPGGLDETYRSDWLKKNPGKKFDRTATEHDEFYTENDPLLKVTEDDWDEAQDRLVTRRATEIARTAASETMSKRDQEMKRGSASQQAEATVDRIFTKAVSGLSPELAELSKDPEKLKTLPEVDPIAAHVSVISARNYEPAVNGVEEIFSAGEKFDPKNPAHQAVDRLGVELEDTVLRAPPEDRRRGNLEFATMEDYGKMSAAEKRKYWTIGRNELLHYIEYRQVQDSASLYKQLGGGKSGANGRPATNGTPATETPAAAPPTNSPSIGSSAAAPPPGTPNPVGGGVKGGSFYDSLRK